MLRDYKVNTKTKLATHWACLMSLYIYADYFELKIPGKIEEVMKLKTPVGDATPELLVIFSLILIVPSLMIVLSVILKPKINKWLNIIVALLWASMSVLIVIGEINDIGGWYSFYLLYQFAELFVFGSIVWHAWRWAKH
ncbi:DUF6326 family protein [Aquimarina spongiae]|uniref:Uncharacterized protein n=1 Tax=Aquimarina spongiae TaxID=570521 RepID=A0A1M6HF29_9FLAO|nr:DUF6326 family protein [Aquimarina spongiae]SHJ20831.1 hypothetical protein SAMN04488508_106253 [Aquimarina spongiae]